MLKSNEVYGVVDLETLGFGQTAIVMSVAINAWTPHLLLLKDSCDITHMPKFQSAHVILPIERQEKDGRTVGVSTIAWWSLQSNRELINLSYAASDIEAKLLLLDQFMRKYGVKYLIGNSPAFDNAILRSLFAQYDFDFPISFRNDIDLRTLKHVSGIDKFQPMQLTAHDAWNDVVYETWCIKQMLKAHSGADCVAAIKQED